MPSDAMRVWVDVHQAYCGGSIHMKLGDSRAAAAVIERAIAEAVGKERAKAEKLAEALRYTHECCDDMHFSQKALAALRAWEDTDADVNTA